VAERTQQENATGLASTTGKAATHDEPGAGGDAALLSWDGQQWKHAMAAATTWLNRHSAAINALNVFPVPDGDTGTNMSLTMQAAYKTVAESPSHSVAEVAAAMAHGALMGARGNSGVILSQVFRGFSKGLKGNGQLSAAVFAEALREAAATAYQAVLKPVEGTMLTVIREMAEGAEAAVAAKPDLLAVLEATMEAGRRSVARTPELLDKLRDAGVVDSGGQGLFVLLEGIVRYGRGESVEGPVDDPTLDQIEPEGGVHIEHGEYGYCTNFILVGKELDFPEIRRRIAAMGDSAVIVGDERLIKVHIHTEQPGTVLNYATALGNLRQVAITDMQEQHDEYMAVHVADAAPAPPRQAKPSTAEVSGTATLAVVVGSGLRNAFESMGATALIEGGQTMNPSTEELLRAVEALPHTEVIILPNNGNIIMAAKQTQALTRKRVIVVPTETIPQGMAALVAFNYDADIETNARAMEQAAAGVETGEIATAVRDATLNGVSVKVGEVIGLHNGALVVAGSDEEAVAWDLLKRMQAGDREIITIYYGQDKNAEAANAFADRVREEYPDQEVEVINGGQPFYAYLISAE
jgi:DAK2 domain fusion protein YloV